MLPSTNMDPALSTLCPHACKYHLESCQLEIPSLGHNFTPCCGMQCQLRISGCFSVRSRCQKNITSPTTIPCSRCKRNSRRPFSFPSIYVPPDHVCLDVCTSFHHLLARPCIYASKKSLAAPPPPIHVVTFHATMKRPSVSELASGCVLKPSGSPPCRTSGALHCAFWLVSSHKLIAHCCKTLYKTTSVLLDRPSSQAHQPSVSSLATIYFERKKFDGFHKLTPRQKWSITQIPALLSAHFHFPKSGAHGQYFPSCFWSMLNCLCTVSHFSMTSHKFSCSTRQYILLLSLPPKRWSCRQDHGSREPITNKIFDTRPSAQPNK